MASAVWCIENRPAPNPPSVCGGVAAATMCCAWKIIPTRGHQHEQHVFSSAVQCWGNTLKIAADPARAEMKMIAQSIT